MNYFAFMDRKPETEKDKKKKTGGPVHKAKLATKAFQVGVSRVINIVKNKDKLKQFNADMANQE